MYMLKSNSQLNQDINVVSFYNNLRNGYFIEIGASDGVSLSNTYLLEKEYEWKGICVEPIPDEFNKLIKNRKSLCSNRAIYSESNKSLDFVIKNFTLCSGLINTMDENVTIDNIVYDRSVSHDKKEIIKVNTITLNDLLDQANAPKFIEYLSLDTEGSELEILKSVDLNKYTFGLIDVEHNFVEPRRTNIHNLLTKNNYKFNKQNNFDDQYIHMSLIK
jgi:FkbM family methyltransferase